MTTYQISDDCYIAPIDAGMLIRRRGRPAIMRGSDASVFASEVLGKRCFDKPAPTSRLRPVFESLEANGVVTRLPETQQPRRDERFRCESLSDVNDNTHLRLAAFEVSQGIVAVSLAAGVRVHPVLHPRVVPVSSLGREISRLVCAYVDHAVLIDPSTCEVTCVAVGGSELFIRADVEPVMLAKDLRTGPLSGDLGSNLCQAPVRVATYDGDVVVAGPHTIGVSAGTRDQALADARLRWHENRWATILHTPVGVGPDTCTAQMRLTERRSEAQALHDIATGRSAITPVPQPTWIGMCIDPRRLIVGNVEVDGSELGVCMVIDDPHTAIVRPSIEEALFAFIGRWQLYHDPVHQMRCAGINEPPAVTSPPETAPVRVFEVGPEAQMTAAY